MGTFAKIFIVVNLVLAVIVLGAGAALLGTAESWKARYQNDDVSALTADAENRDWRPDETRIFNQNVVDALKLNAGEVDGLKKKIDELKSQLLGKTTEKERLEEKLQNAETEWKLIAQKYNQMQEDFGAHVKAFKALEKQLADARTEAKDMQDRVDQATADALAAKQAREEVESNLARTEGQLKQSQEALAAAEKSNTQLGEEKVAVENELAMYKDVYGAMEGAKAMEAVEGVVTGVDEDLNIVLISVGKDDNVAVGYTFKVFRGKEFVGMLIIDRVGDDWAAGHMNKAESTSFPQRGDDVATRL
jgi:hypothetical protein